MRPLVAFDESGNSGANLLFAEQPVFTLASVLLSEEEALQLLPTRGAEAKFSALKRSQSGQRSILSALDSPLLNEQTCLISVVHKPYMAVTKMIDLLIEPVARRHGSDLYDRGANIGLANLWFHTMPLFLGRPAYDDLIGRFVAMVRLPSARSVERFYQFVNTGLRKHRANEDATYLLGMLRSTNDFARLEIERWHFSNLDPAIPTFVDHAATWTARLDRPFEILHDSSKPLAAEQLVLEAMMSEVDERVTIGFDRRTMRFPIAADGIVFGDSKESARLQVADLVAGAACYFFSARVAGRQDDFVESLGRTMTLSSSVFPLWPSLAVTPGELDTEQTGGIDANDHVGEYVARRLGGIPPHGERRKR